ncbi:MAG: hypothetical protein LW629_01430 [Burkholderiales bacterium]|nr:hypothetical protein [Burkholderiales bacterium]
MKAKSPQDHLAHEIENLKQPLMGRRAISWALFLPALLAFLILPVLASLYPDSTRSFLETFGMRAAQQAQMEADKNAAPRPTPTGFALDASWNPGEVAGGHQPWANDCRVCHSESFTQVKDSDCLSCHKDIGDHVEKGKLDVTGLDGIRCAECHRDHKGQMALANQNKHYSGTNCESCHINIKANAPKSEIRDVGDFAKKHPEFRVQVATGPKKEDLRRVLLSDKEKAVEKTGLKFPHDVHLDKKGIKGPKGENVMKCADCHVGDGTGVSFKETNMKDHCQSCHELRFEPTLSNRQVPHGSVEEVLSTLREFYSYVSSNRVPDTMKVTGEILQIRPGSEEKKAPAAPLVTSGDAKTRATLAAKEMFEKTACLVCHEISKGPAVGDTKTTGSDLPQYTVAKVTPQHAWMPQAKFNHKAHDNQACTDCHKANESKKSSDVLMPSIEGCKDCHVGKQPVKNKIASDCGYCHGYHLPAHKAEEVDGKAKVTALAPSVLNTK